ncbi:MAG: beta-ketoacyl synthase N-terminal-like domain-containing protein [Desulfobacterales bacterium]
MIADITGIGWVTAAGIGTAKNNDLFAMPNGPLPCITIDEVEHQVYRYFRRLDDYSKLGLTAISFALKDSGLNEWKEKRDIGIIVSTEYGSMSTDIDYFETVLPQNGLNPSPALFAYTLPNSFLGEASIRFGLTGLNFVVNEPASTGLTGIQMAMDCIASGEIEKMLCGVCDLGCPQMLGAKSNLPPGALFFMLERFPAKDSSSYGPVGLDSKGHILFNQTEIKNPAVLVQKCLARYRAWQKKK